MALDSAISVFPFPHPTLAGEVADVCKAPAFLDAVQRAGTLQPDVHSWEENAAAAHDLVLFESLDSNFVCYPSPPRVIIAPRWLRLPRDMRAVDLLRTLAQASIHQGGRYALCFTRMPSEAGYPGKLPSEFWYLWYAPMMWEAELMVFRWFPDSGVQRFREKNLNQESEWRTAVWKQYWDDGRTLDSLKVFIAASARIWWYNALAERIPPAVARFSEDLRSAARALTELRSEVCAPILCQGSVAQALGALEAARDPTAYYPALERLLTLLFPEVRVVPMA